MKKAEKERLDANAPYFFGLTPKDMFAIVKLAMANDIDWKNYDHQNQLTFGVYRSTPNVYNDFSNDAYAQVNIPLPEKGGYSEYKVFEFKIFEDGFVSYEQGSGIRMRYANPIKVHRLVAKGLRKKKEM